MDKQWETAKKGYENLTIRTEDMGDFIRRALALLPVRMCNNHNTRLKVGQALFEFGLGGYVIYDRWSKGSVEYKPGICLGEWNTFKENSPITFAFVIRSAEQSYDPSKTHYANWEDLKMELSAIAWDWAGWAPRGFLSMIVGSQGVGKSMLALRIAGCYVMGWPWPDGTEFTGERGCVVWAEGEASQTVNIGRAEAWGIEVSKILTPHGMLADFHIHNEEHRKALWWQMAQQEVKAGFVDSLSGIHEGKENDAEMTRIVKPFAELARDTGKLVFLTHHLNKPPQGSQDILTLHRVRGSGTITQSARAVWGIDTPDQDQPETRRVQMLKCNLREKPEPFGFIIDGRGPNFCGAPQPTEGRRRPKLDQAKEMLYNLLGEGPMERNGLVAALKAANISQAVIYRARAELKLVDVRTDGVLRWSLPSGEQMDFDV